MKPDMFKEPVSILVGLGFPAEMRSAMDAYRYLSEWPADLRDNAHSVALKACGAALRGEIEADTARGLFLPSLKERSVGAGNELHRLVARAPGQDPRVS